MSFEWNIDPEEISGIFQRIRRSRPLIHMIPNAVTASLCADGLSALGARPLMAVAAVEMPDIVKQADACVINLGQPDTGKLRAAEAVLEEAGKAAKPLVLDPVGCGASHFRLESVQRLLQMSWQGIIKGNCSEIYSIQQNKLTEEGVDAIAEREISDQIPKDRVYLVTGKADRVLWSGKCVQISHGAGKSPCRYNIVGSGCLTGAVAGACYSVTSCMVTAAIAASLGMAFSLEKANMASGYGAAKAALLDGMCRLSEKEFEEWLER